MAQNSMVYCGVKSPMVGCMAGDMVYSNIPRNTEIRGLEDGNRSGNGYVGGSDLEI
jgi:hypothetical protein